VVANFIALLSSRALELRLSGCCPVAIENLAHSLHPAERSQTGVFQRSFHLHHPALNGHVNPQRQLCRYRIDKVALHRYTRHVGTRLSV
jgi:hypothetical protein